MDKRHIPFFNYQGVFAEHEQDYTKLMQGVLHRGAFILQEELEEFEKKLAEFLGVKHAIGLANCTDALMIALRVAGLQPGDEVILPAHTFIATAAAIHFAGGIPVPVDCGTDHLIDPVAVAAAMTRKTRFLMPVQVNGRTCKMDELQEIAQSRGLQIIEDSAQALGSQYKGQRAGTFGLAGTFSFYPAKILNCFGDGGALVTNDDGIAEQVLLFRDHGRHQNGEAEIWGLNSRLDNLQAAILNFKLERYDEAITRRREIASLYHSELQGLSELSLPPAPGSDPDHFDVYQNYEIEASRRDALRLHLKEFGIGTLIQWGGVPVHHHKKLGFTQYLPKTDAFFERCFLLPMNTMLTDQDVSYICDKINEFYKT